MSSIKYLYVYNLSGLKFDQKYMVENHIRINNRQLDLKKYFDNKQMMDSIAISDITDSLLSKYDVILIDFYCFHPHFYPEQIDKYLQIVKKSKAKKILYLDDLHDYSFRYKQTNICGYKYLIAFLKNYNINYLISKCDCKEFNMILSLGKNIIKKHFIVANYFNSINFIDYKQEKCYDILFYGSTIPSVYMFRCRLKALLYKCTGVFKIKFIELNDSISGKELAMLLNKSLISIATQSKWGYLVRKYFEISAANCVVAGDMPDQGKKIWTDNYIHLDNYMSDTDIVKTLYKYINDKKRLSDMSKNMYDIIHNNYTDVHHADKLYNCCENI